MFIAISWAPFNTKLNASFKLEKLNSFGGNPMTTELGSSLFKSSKYDFASSFKIKYGLAFVLQNYWLFKFT